MGWWSTLRRNIKWSTLLGLGLMAGLGLLTVQAADPSYFGTTVLVSKVATEGGGFSRGDQMSNYVSVAWFNEDCDGSQRSDDPYNPYCNTDVLDAPPRAAFASRATNLVEGMSDEETCGVDAEGKTVYCADIFLARKGSDVVRALTLGGGFTQYPKGDAMFPTLSRDGRWVVFQSASEYAEIEGGDDTPETDIWLMDLRDPDNLRGPYRVSNHDTSTGPDVDADSGNVACRLTADETPECDRYSNGTTKPMVEYPHPVADVYWQDLNNDGQVDVYTEVFVAFESIASNLDIQDGNGHIKDIFLGQASDKGHSLEPQFEQRGSQLLTRAPTCDQSGQPTAYDRPTDGDSYHPVFVDMPGKAQDGRYLLFVSRATNLICGLKEHYPADDPNARPYARRANLFLLDRDNDGNGTYDEFDQPGGVRIYLISQNASGKPANGTSEYPAVAYVEENGQPRLYVAFQSRASDLAPINLPEGKSADDNGFTDIYLFKWDLTNGSIQERYLVSVPSVPLDDESQRPAALANLASYAPAISRDGLVISFHSYADNLIEGDTNNICPYTTGEGIEGTPTTSCPDVFAHDWNARQTWRVSLTSNGQQGAPDSVYGGLSATGQFAFFASYADLDLNNETPIYQNVLQIYLRDMGNPPGNPNVQPTFQDWGILHLNQGGEPRLFTVRFLGNLYVSGVTFTPKDIPNGENPFTFSHQCQLDEEYGRGEHCTFTVGFNGGSVPDKEYAGEVLLAVKRQSNDSPRTVRIGVRAKTAYYGVLATPNDLSASATPGSTLTYTFEVQNAGDLAEDLTLRDVHAGNGSWVSALPEGLENVAPGNEDTRTVQVQVRVPASGVSVGESHVDQIEVCSSHDPAACMVVSLTTTVDQFRVFIPAVMR
ncbi:hypothetical protein SE15_13120 [Thermanaerothrix daxensis]|uniref:Uncharacterized protein n=1 Tax=Thermanaerothrix daxensis TaxID=869279 RepID=A0A0P6XNQ3_9CHLR|nr:hypothetical protein [Thermanaerothrix daxensis]KPL82055.1 hypothetical protein SE15_13120 [Thermanaerothrix daxensis]